MNSKTRTVRYEKDGIVTEILVDSEGVPITDEALTSSVKKTDVSESTPPSRFKSLLGTIISIGGVFLVILVANAYNEFRQPDPKQNIRLPQSGSAIDICIDLKSEEEKAICYVGMALDTRSKSWCLKVTDVDTVSKCEEYVNYWSYDLDECAKVANYADSDVCFATYVNKTGDVTACSKIKNLEIRNLCKE